MFTCVHVALVCVCVVQELVQHSGGDQEQAKVLLEAMDSDNDGRISFEDFRKSMLKVRSQLLSGPLSSRESVATSSPGIHLSNSMFLFVYLPSCWLIKVLSHFLQRKNQIK